MFAKERQDKIHEMVCKNGAVSTSDLVKCFEVSIETVRRDLLEMENKGLLARVHGGAVKVGEMPPFYDLAKRHQSRSAEKTALAQIAITEVNEGDFIAVDSGSTAIHFTEAIRDRFTNLTVVTYSLDVLEILRDHKSIQTILCGGHYLHQENSFYGMLTLDMLDHLHVDKAFICPSAVSLEYGIYDYQPDFAMVQKKMMEISNNVYVLADSGKYEKRALIKLDDMKPEFTYVTDGGLSEELKRLYRENGIHVINEAKRKG